MKIKLALVENVVLGDVHHWDYPDYCDAFIESATYMGRPMTDAELDILNEDSDFIYSMVTELVLEGGE